MSDMTLAHHKALIPAIRTELPSRRLLKSRAAGSDFSSSQRRCDTTVLPPEGRALEVTAEEIGLDQQRVFIRRPTVVVVR